MSKYFVLQTSSQKMSLNFGVFRPFEQKGHVYSYTFGTSRLVFICTRRNTPETKWLSRPSYSGDLEILFRNSAVVSADVVGSR